MPSLVPGFEYDIFISYRQNDNRSGWVTEFVKALQEELASTIKDPVSVYFDTNPHDGLLETHNVDKSLEGKLKCLIFIPIISQTYCDPKSFAWQHEFCAFNKLGKEDQFGRDVKLSNGNVASRILPIKIHDIEAEDKTLLENELGSVLRPIEFIFKSAGVNRPLKTNDDRTENLNHTYYHDQVNKVANAVKEILNGLKNFKIDTSPVSSQPARFSSFTEPRPKVHTRRYFANSAAVLLVLLLAGYFVFNFTSLGKKFQPEQLDKSIAVLPFVNMSNDKDQDPFSDGMTDQIITNLAKLKVLNVIGRTSMMHYKGSQKTIAEIAKELNDVSYVLEGSIQKSGNRIKVNAQLIRAKDSFHQWAEVYDRDLSDIFAVQDELSGKIVQALLGELQPDQKDIIKTDRPTNVEAYEYYQKGIHAHIEMHDLHLAEQMFLKALLLDPSYATAYGALADLYDTEGNLADKQLRAGYWKKRDSVVRIGVRINPKSAYVLFAMGLTFSKRSNPNLDSAFYFFQKSHEIDPNNQVINMWNGQDLLQIGLAEKSKRVFKRVLVLDPVNERARAFLSFAQYISGDIEGAEINTEKILEQNKSSLTALLSQAHIAIFYKKDLDKAKRIYQTMSKIDPNSERTKYVGSLLLATEGKLKDAKMMKLEVLSILNIKNEAIQRLDSLTRLDSWMDPWTYLRLKNDKVLDFIRNEPEFQTILLREKKVYEDRLAKYGHMLE